MSIEYPEQIARAIEAVRIHSATSYSWFGKRSTPLPKAIRDALDAEGASRCLRTGLQHQLYADFYTHGFATPSSETSNGSPAAAVAEHVARLSAANRSRGYWDPGWIIERAEAKHVEVRKGQFRLEAQYNDLDVAPIDCLAGSPCRLRFASEESGTSPGYYSTTGEIALPASNASLFRIYWNIAAAAAIPLMRHVTVRLNREGIPFRFKLLKDPAAYIRCDAAVLYVPESELDVTARFVSEMLRTLARDLKPGIPAMSRQVAVGIALAQDPVSGESFGLHRCGLIADGLIRAYGAGVVDIEGRMQFVESRFAESGIGLDRPYLNPGTPDPEIVISPPQRAARRNPTVRLHPSTVSELIEAADRIGSRLCEQALWHEGRCNWMGLVSDPGRDSESPSNSCRALGPEMYSGASGVALFLAQLYAVAPSRKLRETALGAIRQAIARCGSIPPEVRLGLYSGLPGIALSATRVGKIVGDESCLTAAKALSGRIAKDVSAKRKSEFDLLSGKAGAIIGLLFLNRELEAGALLENAILLGDRLLRSAKNASGMCSWESVNFRARRNLTGFSHGTAGVAYALLELWRVTGDSRYRQAAEMAFAYERRWYSPVEQNWPDFRETAGRRSEPAYATAWCHGAPGIALSRLRAWELTGDETCRSEAVTAARTTRTMLRFALDSGATASTLCHGLAGNADILAEMATIDRDQSDATLLNAVASRVKPEAERPSLMVGQAGVGYFFLRLADRAVPSVLLVRIQTS